MPPLLYRRLERAHHAGRWDEELNLHPRHTYDWFCDVQMRLQTECGLGEATATGVLYHTVLLSQAMRRRGDDTLNARTVSDVLQTKQGLASAAYIARRLYRSANVVFHTLMGELDRPLPVPRARRGATLCFHGRGARAHPACGGGTP